MNCVVTGTTTVVVMSRENGRIRKSETVTSVKLSENTAT